MTATKFTSKTLLELILMSILASREYSTTEILKKLETIDFKVPKGTLQPLLSSLISEKIIESSIGEMDTGPARKCYFITNKGEIRLKQIKRDWHNINRIITRASKAL